MADPKITAPVGSHFMLKWTADGGVKVTNVFELIDGTTKEFAGRALPKGRPVKGAVKVFLSITKDGKKDGYRVNLPRPGDREGMTSAGKFFQEYTFIFRAKEPAVYQFTVDIPDAVPPLKLTKEVTVVAADVLNDRRQDMLDLIDRWLPSSVMGT